MRISKSRTVHRQVAYTVELSEYDAQPPANVWLLDGLPDKVNPELEAVALYLIFGSWCGGEFLVPQKMGPNTAAAITRHAGMDFFPGPIEYYPKPILRGSRMITVSEDLGKAGNNSLVLLGGSSWNGSLKSTSSLVLSSNTEIFSTEATSSITKLAPAVLLAEVLDVAEILMDFDLGEVDESVSNLLRQVGIAIKNS